MIVDARSLVLALVGLPAVVGFGKLPGLGVESNFGWEERVDLAYLNDLKGVDDDGNPVLDADGNQVVFDVCKNLVNPAKAHSDAFGDLNFLFKDDAGKDVWCGSIKTKEECGDPEAEDPLTNVRVGKKRLTTDFGETRFYDICAWDKNFKKTKWDGTVVEGKCRLSGWSFPCPVGPGRDDPHPGCPGEDYHYFGQRADDGIRQGTLEESCSTKLKKSQLYFKKSATSGAFTPQYHPLETCVHRLIDEGRRLNPDEEEPPAASPRRLDSPSCPDEATGVVEKIMGDGSICCDTSEVVQLNRPSLVEAFQDELPPSTMFFTYKENCVYDSAADSCDCTATKERVIATPVGPRGCPAKIKAIVWDGAVNGR